MFGIYLFGYELNKVFQRSSEMRY